MNLCTVAQKVEACADDMRGRHAGIPDVMNQNRIQPGECRMVNEGGGRRKVYNVVHNVAGNISSGMYIPK